MIVVDASVLANVVGDDEAAGQLARTRFAAASAVSAPDLVDVETVAVLRRRWVASDLSDERFRAAVDDLLALPITRFPVGPLMVRAFELRADITACYVALAETLDCPLITADRRLANEVSSRHVGSAPLA